MNRRSHSLSRPAQDADAASPAGLTRRRAIAVAAAVALLAGPSLSRAETGVTDSEILLGAVYALTGPVRFITTSYEQGVQSVLNEVNATGIHGRKIRWLIEDDAYQPARTLAGAKKLVERDNVFALFGQIGLPTTLAVVPYAEQAKVPFLSLTATSSPPPVYTWGMQASYTDLMYVLTQHVVKTLGLKKVGYLFQNDDLGEAGKVGVTRALKELNVPLMADVGYERGTTDFGTQVLKLRDSGAEMVISMGTAPSTATAIKQAAAYGYKPTWGTYGVGGSGTLPNLLGDLVNGLVFATEVDSIYSDAPGVAEARRVIAKHFPNAQPDFTTFMGYAHAKVVAKALEVAGRDLTREKLLAAMVGLGNFDSGVMPLSFSKDKHTGSNGVKIFQWRGGKPVAISPWTPITK